MTEEQIGAEVGELENSTTLEAPIKKSKAITGTAEAGTATAGSLFNGYKLMTLVMGGVLVLVVFLQVYMLSALKKTSVRLDDIEEELIATQTQQKKAEVEQDKRLLGTVDEKIKSEINSVRTTLYKDALDRLRGGQAEKKVLRKQAGEWFVLNKKGEEPVVVPELVEALNHEYKRADAKLAPGRQLPPHSNNVVCVLRADGKGGTAVGFSHDYLIAVK